LVESYSRIHGEEFSQSYNSFTSSITINPDLILRVLNSEETRCINDTPLDKLGLEISKNVKGDYKRPSFEFL
jgi:hypothetical protein